MSTRTMAQVWPLQMPPTPKAVLVSLADNANDAGECWPSINTICERTCFGRTAVMDAIVWLETGKYLVADRSNGRHTKYQITFPSADLFETDKPVRLADRSASRTGPPPVHNQSASRTAPVRQADSNHKEKKETKKKDISPKLDFSIWPAQPSADVLADWLALRKRKRADVSVTVIKTMAKQLVKARELGWTVDDALAEAVMRGWTGFNVEWLPAKNGGSGQQSGKSGQRPSDDSIFDGVV